MADYQVNTVPNNARLVSTQFIEDANKSCEILQSNSRITNYYWHKEKLPEWENGVMLSNHRDGTIARIYGIAKSHKDIFGF
jgi:hypothetical protein